MTLGAHLCIRLLQHMIYKLGVINSSFFCCSRVEYVSDVFEEWAIQIPKAWYRKVTLRPVDYFCRDEFASCLFKNIFASTANLKMSRDARGKLHHFVIEKRHPGLQTERHRHVIDAFHGVIDQHNLRIDLQRLVGRTGGWGPRQKNVDE